MYLHLSVSAQATITNAQHSSCAGTVLRNVTYTRRYITSPIPNSRGWLVARIGERNVALWIWASRCCVGPP